MSSIITGSDIYKENINSSGKIKLLNSNRSFSDAEFSFIKDNKKHGKIKNFDKLFKVVICVLSVVLIAELTFHLIISPKLLIKKLEIISAENVSLSNEEILSITGLSGSEKFFQLNSKMVQKKLEQHPLIKNAKVTKKIPDTIVISVSGRQSVAVVIANIDGNLIPAAVDSDGVIHNLDLDMNDLSLPILSGIDFKTIKAGLEMPDAIKPFLKSLSVIKESNQQLFNLISEIEFITEDGESFEVLIYPADYYSKVRLGDEITEPMLRNIFLLLDHVKREGLSDKLEELDFRMQKTVYKIREGL